MWIAAAFITTLSFGANNTIFKWSTARGLSKVHIQFFFYFIAFFLTVGYGLANKAFHLQAMTILLGSMIGILNAVGNIQMSKAFEKGPASLTSPLIGTNAFLPIISAWLIFHEHITLLQWVGITVMLGSAVLIQYAPSANRNASYLPWVIRIVLAILAFGILGVLMKTTSYLHINSLSTLISMYGGGSIYLALASTMGKEKWRRPEITTGSLVGLISIVGYSFYFYALKTGVASIVFPIVSLNCLVVVLAGYWVFKEKLKLYQIIGVFTALVGIVFTKI